MTVTEFQLVVRVNNAFAGIEIESLRVRRVP